MPYYCNECEKEIGRNDNGFCSKKCEENFWFSIESGYTPTPSVGKALELEIRGGEFVLKTA
jgi:hypothetical protein